MNGSQSLYERALRLSPGGVHSPVRAFDAVGGRPTFIERASGAHLYDADGREYVDLIGSWGAAIVGHAHPRVVERVRDAVGRGQSFGLSNAGEVELAQRIVDRTPSVERVRFVNSGTEAVMSAIRLARAATGRDGVIKFKGCYHGHADPLLVRAGSGVATLTLPDSPGLPAGATAHTHLADFNDLESVGRLIDGDDPIAAIIVEPVTGNMGVIAPESGFLAGLRALADRSGALLIFDEVMTGFRVHSGSAQTLYNVVPDLTTFGKVIGGGLPIGAYGGRAALMEMISPSGSVYQAGTMSGNPVVMASGIATLDLLGEAGAYDRLHATGDRLAEGLRSVLGAGCAVHHVGSMVSVFFGVDGVRHFGDVAEADHERFGLFFRHLLDCGVHLPPSGYESWFVSLSHTFEDIDRVIDASSSFSA